ncbi:hypothetical protein Pst134EA_003342 [Puccinia striiformis f. sp. tritici]|uniref:hypothetical protein n=1 Tax=Puccinia striiformis f. sp. tritici TaxID=168172 RepID=UPI0020088660|nr:hypothetical protein Pst134EA_003342 [Puccinia striiformis f. sp. tritici]KAH9472734.1 hypothetical protein Pst134EA_003342 [Puccinia striiformis f. sp. tritici]
MDKTSNSPCQMETVAILPSMSQKMQVAAKAAKDLEIISRFSDPNFQPPKAKPAFPPHLYQHPHSTQRARHYGHPTPLLLRPLVKLSPIRNTLSTGVFGPAMLFRCLKRTPPPGHSGPSNCPNGGTSSAEKERFVERYRLSPPVGAGRGVYLRSSVPLFVSRIRTSPIWSTGVHPPAMSTSSAPPSSVHESKFRICEIYNDLSEAHLATVKVCLDTSRTGRIMVPVSFQVSPSRSVVASVLVDMGATANFINWKFIDNHQLLTRQRKTPDPVYRLRR